MPRDRADVIVAGGAVLLVVLEGLGLGRFWVSERNILDGFMERALGAG
jgi:exopolyphosphatase/pppGpp-phosphohydrolase